MSAIKFSGRFIRKVSPINKVKLPVATLLLGLVIAGCDHIIDADTREQLVTAQVHLQEGFQRHHVSVSCDGEVYLEELLAPEVPLAGSLAVFRLNVPSGTHQLGVCWVPIDGNREVGTSEAAIKLQPAEYYYVGLALSGDSVRVCVQEEPFFYM